MNKALFALVVLTGCTLQIEPSPETVTVPMLEQRLQAMNTETARFISQVERHLNELYKRTDASANVKKADE